MKIGSHSIKIVFAELEEDNAKFDWSKNTITIEESLPPDQMFSALIHEVMHVCNSTLDSSDMGHALLDSLAEQLSDVLIANDMIDKSWYDNFVNRKPTLLL